MIDPFLRASKPADVRRLARWLGVSDAGTVGEVALRILRHVSRAPRKRARAKRARKR